MIDISAVFKTRKNQAKWKIRENSRKIREKIDKNWLKIEKIREKFEKNLIKNRKNREQFEEIKKKVSSNFLEFFEVSEQISEFGRSVRRRPSGQ